MKTLKSLLLAVAVIVTIISCQKEESLESGIPSVPSTGTLQDTVTGICLGNTVNGNYVATTSLASAENIQIQVQVLTPGSYTIISDTVNGYYFKGTGFFNNTGIQIVNLQGHGAPFNPGTDIFLIGYDNTFCEAVVTVLPSGSSGTSVFTLGGAGGACSGVVLEGDYIQGVPLSASTNHAIIQVDVTTVGTYFINTPVINGISFSGSGTFIFTGAQPVTLNGNGIPTSSGNMDFTITSGANTCDFIVPVMPPVVSAVYTLGSTAGNCNATLSGSYAVGVALGSSNTVELAVDVASIGSWTINTTTVNGMSFSGSGLFSAIGPQTIILQGSGTAAAVGTNTFPVVAGISTCAFQVTVTATPTAPCNPADNTADLSGVTTISFTTVTGAPGVGMYSIVGNGTAGDVVMDFAGAAQPTAGVYNIQPSGGPFGAGDVVVSFAAATVTWASSTGLVYVTVTGGKVTAVLCNVTFTGIVGGIPVDTDVSAKITEQ